MVRLLAAAAGAPHCHLQLEGFNAEMDLLRGGLDGLYLLRDCHNGKPLYTRAFEDTSGGATSAQAGLPAHLQQVQHAGR